MAKKSRANSAPSGSAAAKGAGGAAARSSVPQQTRAERQARRPDMIRQRKEDRLKTYERQKRQALFTKIGFGVLAVLVVLGAGWWGYGQWQTSRVSEDVQTYFGVSDFAGLHESGDILYEQVPPVGGPHNAVWQNCGFYSQYLNNVNAAHSLEHGAVWITYDPDKITDEELQTLKDKTKKTYVLVSPYPGIDAPVIASVWGKQIKLDGANDSRLDAFIKNYRQNPDNTPERGALCTLGTSETTTTPPQTEPFVRQPNTDPVGGVTVEQATATAEAANGGGANASTPESIAANANAGTVATPAASPAASPAATPMASPEATPAS